MENSHQVFERSKIYPIILCGGSGTRLWPMSRQSNPKQFLSLDGSGLSLLERCVERIEKIAPKERRWVVTTANQKGKVEEQVKGSIGTVLCEPEPKNTAPAIALTASRLMKEDPDSFMVIVSSDHAIQNTRSFEQSVADAITLAEKNYFVTIGIEPSHAATGFGYIECGLPLDPSGQILPVTRLTEFDRDSLAYSVRSFREKPTKAAAEQFLRTGKYKWNAGIFVWKTSAFWNAFTHLQPEMAHVLESATADTLPEIYSKLEAVPIDVAFMEQTSHVACVPARFDWNDVGSWASVLDCAQVDEQGNSIQGNAMALDTKSSVVHSSGPLVSVIGMERVAVIATDDAILVTPLDRSQDVKKIVEELKKTNQLDKL